MSDLISRQAAIDAICKACSMEGDYHKCDGYPETSTWCDELVALRALPSAQPEYRLDEWCTDCKEYDTEKHCCPRFNQVIRTALKDANLEPCENCISRQAAIDEIKEIYEWHDNVTKERIIEHFVRLPSAQPEKRTEKRTETHACDLIDRQAAIDAIDAILPVEPMKNEYTQGITCGAALAIEYVKQLPSVQPERTCVNCGRTINNGGWYADGRTRCPIEEHYALPKDGFCHLWEKRNITDDDYPERRTDGRD